MKYSFALAIVLIMFAGPHKGLAMITFDRAGKTIRAAWLRRYIQFHGFAIAGTIGFAGYTVTTRNALYAAGKPSSSTSSTVPMVQSDLGVMIGYYQQAGVILDWSRAKGFGIQGVFAIQ